MPTTTITPKPLRIGSRDSKLAIVQSRHVAALLRQAHPRLEVEIETMKTLGDKIQDKTLSKLGDKGIFTKELETALSQGSVDLIVHSLKDMPTQLPSDMELVAITRREDPRDAVIMSKANQHIKHLKDLPRGSTIGTGSVRRCAQLRSMYPDLEIMDIRGNIDTRLAKLDSDATPYDALVLAAAGMQRMHFADRITYKLDDILHAVGQGALGIEIRSSDVQTKMLVSDCLNHRETRLTCLAERRLMRVLEGGCSVPIGVSSQWGHQETLTLNAIVSSPDGKDSVRATCSAKVKDDEAAVELGNQLAQVMLEKGAGVILATITK